MMTVPIRAGVWLAGITIVTALVVTAGRSVMPWGKMFPDLLCYRTAGKLVAAGQSPYDASSQARIQREAGWDRARDGRGVLEFLPFYYPPWFAAACIPLGSMDAGRARTVWFFVNAWLLLASAALLCDAVPGVPRSIALALVPLFFLSILSLLLGQTAILILFLAAAALGLVDRGRDIAGGAVLACLTTKPQLSAVVLLGVLIWAARRRRWRVVTGFALALSALTLFGEWLVPAWPVRLWESMSGHPPPTAAFPWIGASWLLVLRSLGLRSWALGAAYLAAAAPALGAVIVSALDRSRPLRDTFALGLLAAFFVAPYARHYDYPVLLVPLLVLLGDRLTERAGAAVLIAVAFLPYLQFALLVRYQRSYTTTDFFLESTYFWVPLMIALAWFTTQARREPGLSGDGGR